MLIVSIIINKICSVIAKNVIISSSISISIIVVIIIIIIIIINIMAVQTSV